MTHDDLIDSGSEFLAHYGVKGQQRGVRRYQNEDGSLTPEGYRHYGIDPNSGEVKGDLTAGKMARYAKDNYKINYKSAREQGLSRKEAHNQAYNKSSENTIKTYGESNYTIAKDRTNKTIDNAKTFGRITTAIAGFSGTLATGSVLKGAISAATTFLANELAINIAKASSGKKTEIGSYSNAYALANAGGVVATGLLSKGDPRVIAASAAGSYVLHKLLSNLGYNRKIEHNDGSETDSEYLAHYGVPGQKKGVRKYQNEDGSLTPEGYRHYGIDPNSGEARGKLTANRMQRYAKDNYKMNYKSAREQGLSRSEAREKASYKEGENVVKTYGYSNYNKARTNLEYKDTGNRYAREIGVLGAILSGGAALIRTGDPKIAAASAAGGYIMNNLLTKAIYNPGGAAREKIKSNKYTGAKSLDEYSNKFINNNNKASESDKKQLINKMSKEYETKINDIFDDDGGVKKGKEKDYKELEKSYSEMYAAIYNNPALSETDKGKLIDGINSKFEKHGKKVVKHNDGFFFESPDEYLIHSGLDFLDEYMYA